MIMIYMYHNHTLQTNPQHREEDPQNTIWKTNEVKQPALSSPRWLQN